MTFSIIIPVYNAAPYLRCCLDSFLAQTFCNWEAICIDDGSADGSGMVLDEYAAKDSRFRVVHKKNEGVSAARNLGLELSVGEYVTFMDADDKVDPGWLETAAMRIASGHVDLLRMSAKYWHDDGHYQEDAKIDNVRIDNRSAIVEWAWSHLLYRGWSVVLFVRAAVLKQSGGMVGFPVGVAIREDTIWCLRVMSCISSFEQYDFPGYCYRWHAASAYNGRRALGPTVAFAMAFDELWCETCRRVESLRSDGMRRRYTAMQIGNLIEWLERKMDEGRKGLLSLQDALRAPRRRGDFVMSGVCGRWKVAMWWYLHTGSLCAFGLTQNVFGRLSTMKRRMRRLVKG